MVPTEHLSAPRQHYATALTAMTLPTASKHYVWVGRHNSVSALEIKPIGNARFQHVSLKKHIPIQLESLMVLSGHSQG